MYRENKALLLAAGLMATSMLTAAGSAQAQYTKSEPAYAPVVTEESTVTFTKDGMTYETYSEPEYETYSKGGVQPQYTPVVIDSPAPAAPAVYEAAVVPVVEFDDTTAIDSSFDDFSSGGFDTLVTDLGDDFETYDDSLDASVANFVRLNVGYGFASDGTLNYGSGADEEDFSVQDHYASTSSMRGPSASFRADVTSFFVDGQFGRYDEEASVSVEDSLDGIDGSTTAAAAGPRFQYADGTSSVTSGFLRASTTGGAYGADDKLTTSYRRTSELLDGGGAVGYSFDMNGLSFGVGLAGRYLQGSHALSVTQEASDVDGEALPTADWTYADHKLQLDYKGYYVGPAVRVNFDQKLGNRITAHFGGTAQALYAQRTLDAKQTSISGGTLASMDQVKNNGIAFGGEVDAGLGFAVTDNVALSVGGYGSFLTGAPGYKAYDTDLATEGSGDFATLREQTLLTYGVKGGVTVRF